MAKRKKSKSTGEVAISSPSRDEHHSMSVRKISNGYVVSQHGYKGDKHYSHETYHQKAPKVKLVGTEKAMEKKIGNKLI